MVSSEERGEMHFLLLMMEEEEEKTSKKKPKKKMLMTRMEMGKGMEMDDVFRVDEVRIEETVLTS